VTQAAEHLPCKHKAQSSNPSTVLPKKKKVKEFKNKIFSVEKERLFKRVR
jgi:hypothetical protein